MEPIHTHISRQYNTELEEIRSLVLQMGGLVEQQIDQALNALVRGDTALGESVIMDDTKVNKLEVTIDEEGNNYPGILALGQHVRQMVHDALAAVARPDIEAGLRTAREDYKIDQKYEGVM